MSRSQAIISKASFHYYLARSERGSAHNKFRRRLK